MNLQGFYTDLGRALAAKIAAGTAALTVTRVVAGSGHTADIPSATSLPDIEQTLTVGTPEVRGVTATLPVTLTEASAASDYSLTELGVYASDPQEGEILMQVYQLSTPQEIAAHGEGMLRFYLRQSVGAQGVTVTCSPAGTLVDADLDPLRGRVFATSAPSRTVTVAASELVAYVAALPRLLTEYLTIEVASGTVTNELAIKGFYGSGSLLIKPQTENGVTFTNLISCERCSVFVEIEGFTIQAPDSAATSLFNMILVRYCSFIRVAFCEINGITGTNNARAINAGYGGTVIFESVTVSNVNSVALISNGSMFYLRGCSGSNNNRGLWTYHGAAIVASDDTPILMGAVSNSKNGGPIFNAGQLS